MTNAKTLVVLLGVNGTLSESVIRHIAEARKESHDIIGFDVQESTLLPVQTYKQCDLRNREQINAALDSIPYGQYKDIRLLICAAVMNRVSLSTESFDEDALYEEAAINFTGPMHFTLGLANRVLSAGSKMRVVLIGSTAAYVGSNDPCYAAAKAGNDGLVRSLSKYLAQKGVTAISLHTGIFQSAMSAAVSDERKKKTLDMTHIKRIGSVEEIRDHVNMYLLDAGDFATGMIVDINGGQHC